MKNSASKFKQKRFKVSRDFILLTIGIMICIGGAVWLTTALVRHRLAIDNQRAQFAQAEKDLDDLSAAIIAKFGKPAAYQQDKSCTYTSNTNEFERGDLVCDISYNEIYNANDNVAAHQVTRNISEFIATSSYLKFKKSSSFFDDNVPPVEILNQDLSSITGMDCGASYTFYTNNNYPSGFLRMKESIPANGLLVELTCGTYAKAAYYPIVN